MVVINPRFKIDDVFVDLDTGQVFLVKHIEIDCNPYQYALESHGEDGNTDVEYCPEDLLLRLYRHIGTQGSLVLDTSDPTTITVASEPVSATTERLQILEGEIKKAIDSFLAAGRALKEIKEARLYTVRYATFEEYVVNCWDFRAAHAYRLMDAAALVEQLSPIGEAGLPATESQCRELLRLPQAERQEAWAAVAMASARPTAKLIASEVERRLIPQEVRPVSPPTPAPDTPAAVEVTAIEEECVATVGTVAPAVTQAPPGIQTETGEHQIPPEVFACAREMGLKPRYWDGSYAQQAIKPIKLSGFDLYYCPTLSFELLRAIEGYIWGVLGEALVIYLGSDWQGFYDSFCGLGSIQCCAEALTEPVGGADAATE